MTKTIGIALCAAYAGTIVLANWLIVEFGLVPVGFGLMAPAGVFAVGVAFTLRDLIQRLLGRAAVIAMIIIGAGLSFLVAPNLAVASGAAFLISESLDFAVYTPLERRRFLLAVGASNIVGLVADSIAFLLLAFGSLEFLAGQVVGKAYMTVLAVAILVPLRRVVPVRA